MTAGFDTKLSQVMLEPAWLWSRRQESDLYPTSLGVVDIRRNNVHFSAIRSAKQSFDALYAHPAAQCWRGLQRVRRVST